MRHHLKFVLTLCMALLSLSGLKAQDYKHPYGLVDKEGKVTDPDGISLGSITKDGIIKDASGIKIGEVDGQGNLIDTKTGKSMGHVPKNGAFVYYYKEQAKDSLSTGIPRNGTCEVKDSKGQTVILVHENYKHIGACAYHCLYLKKHGQTMHMK